MSKYNRRPGGRQPSAVPAPPLPEALAAASPADVFAAAAAALQRLADPVLSLLLWCIAARGEASPEICELLGLRSIDLAMFSAAHHEQLLRVRATRSAGLLLGRAELGGMMRAALARMLETATSHSELDAALRAGTRMPAWAIDPELSAAEATLKLQEAAVRTEENSARKAEARVREAIAGVRLADPEAYAGPRLELLDPAWPPASPSGWGALTEPDMYANMSLEEMIAQTKFLVSEYEKEQADLAADRQREEQSAGLGCAGAGTGPLASPLEMPGGLRPGETVVLDQQGLASFLRDAAAAAAAAEAEALEGTSAMPEPAADDSPVAS